MENRGPVWLLDTLLEGSFFCVRGGDYFTKMELNMVLQHEWQIKKKLVEPSCL